MPSERREALRVTGALKAAGAICAVGILAFALGLDLPGRMTGGALPDEAAAAQETAQQAGYGSHPLLFPALNASRITAITVSTPERSFRFDAEGGEVSVNGRQADAEIYETLVNQIAALPVDRIGAFTPDSAQLLLVITVCADGAEQTARFYEDGGTGETAWIIAGTADAPAYAKTSGWRVGTLMMTCEGTRIQDERGNERPAAFSTAAPGQP